MLSCLHNNAMFLKHLHKKSERTRQVIAFVVTLVITLGIAAGWLASLGGRFEKAAEESSESTRPFVVLKEFFSQSALDFSESKEERKALFQKFKDARQKDEAPEEPQTIDEIEAAIDALNSESESEIPLQIIDEGEVESTPSEL